MWKIVGASQKVTTVIWNEDSFYKFTKMLLLINFFILFQLSEEKIRGRKVSSRAKSFPSFHKLVTEGTDQKVILWIETRISRSFNPTL